MSPNVPSSFSLSQYIKKILLGGISLILAVALLTKSASHVFLIDPKDIAISRLEYQTPLNIDRDFFLAYLPKPSIAYADDGTDTNTEASAVTKKSFTLSLIESISNFFNSLFVVKPTETSTPTPVRDESIFTTIIQPKRDTPELPVTPNQNIPTLLLPPSNPNSKETIVYRETPTTGGIDPSIFKRLTFLENEYLALKNNSSSSPVVQYVTNTYTGGASYSVPADTTAYTNTIVNSTVNGAVTGGSSAFSGASLTVTGNVTANSFYGDGSNLTGISSFSTSTTRSVLSSSATGLTYSSTTGAFSLTSGYSIPLTASTTSWITASNLNSLSPIQVGFGNAAAGTNASALGRSNTASGCFSSASGFCNTASGCFSSAVGYFNTASGGFSSAFGSNINNSTANSVEIGAADTEKLQISSSGVNFVTAGAGGFCVNGVSVGGGGGDVNALSPIQVGFGNSAAGTNASALGYCNTASGYYSSAFGYQNTAPGCYGSASGFQNTASGCKSSAFGYQNTASGYYSSAIGSCNTTSGPSSSAFGFSNVATGDRSSAGGYGSSASGIYSSAFGYQNTATGVYSSASGFCNTTNAILSNSFGSLNGICNITSIDNTTGVATYSGYAPLTSTAGVASTMLGIGNNATGLKSSAVGYLNTASGYHSSAFGYQNTASGYRSSAFGNGLTNSTAESAMIGSCGGWLNIISDSSVISSSGACLTAGGTWTNASSRNLKENFTDVNSDDILAKINSLNIQQWNYKTEDASITHIGPLAQDFYAAFNLGGSDKSISTIDPAGVALIGIQALSKRLDSMQGPTLFGSLSINLATSTPEETSSWNNIFIAFKNFGVEIIDGIAYLKNVFIEKLTVNTVKVKDGIEMKSPDGSIYCVTINNQGDFEKKRGDCDTPNPIVPTNTGGGVSDTGSNSSDTGTTTPNVSDTTASSTESTTNPQAEITTAPSDVTPPPTETTVTPSDEVVPPPSEVPASSIEVAPPEPTPAPASISDETSTN